MGLGKTIMTIALLAHMACARGVWGPHLIVVPTSVMLNWEMEFKKWCPGFKLLTYYGTVAQRKAKRTGWSKPGAFHVCITSYTVVLQDAKMFRRKRWQYLILDEAHMIKNWKSQRWQVRGRGERGEERGGWGGMLCFWGVLIAHPFPPPAPPAPPPPLPRPCSTSTPSAASSSRAPPCRTT
jgi:hypothetical protein